MKIKLLFALLFITSVSTYNISAQNLKSITIENIDKEVVWPAVFKAFQELKFPRPSIAKKEGTGETNYYNYKSLMVKNRLRFKINYQADSLTISIFERQYYTNTGWADNPLPISKKRVRKILGPIKERIIELTKNKTITGVNNKTQTNKDLKTIKKAGIFEDFILVRTEDSEMDVLAIHKNGNIMGFDLYDDLKTVKTIVSRENKDSEAIIMEFDKNGLPIGMGIKNLSFKIISNTNGELILKLKDQEGNFIGEEKITMNPPPINQSTREFIEDNENHGPSSFFEFQEITLNLSYDLDDLSDGLGRGSFWLSVLEETLDELPESSKFAKALAFGKVLPKKLSKGLLLAYAIQKIDPENKFLLNELSTFVPIVATAIGATVVGATSLSVVAGIGIIVGSAKISVDAYISLKERHWPTPKIVIIKANEPIRTGSFGEYHLSSGYVAVEYNYNEAIEIISEHDDDLKFKLSSTDILNGYAKTYFNVSAKESINKKHRITAFYIVDGEKISEEIEIQIEEPKYYYLTNCNNCSDDPSHKQECEERLEQCISSIKAEDNIYFVLDKNNKIIDCNKDLNDARKNYVKSSTLINHGFKSFVTEAQCSYNCEGSVDKQTIISLAHEAMDKIKAIEDKAEALGNVVNETNYLKIGMEIQNLKKKIDPIKKEYIEKINKIAEKRTISYSINQTDPAKYYSAKKLTVYSSHWSMNHITILLDVSFIRKHSEKRVEIYSGEIKTYLEDLRELRFQFQFKNNNEVSNHTIPVFKGKTNASFGISFKNFEKETDYVNFKSSLANDKLIE